MAAGVAAEAVRWNSTAQVMLIAEWDEINHPDYPKEMLEAIKRIPDDIASIHNYFNDMTIASFSAGMVGYTVIINNKNGNVWITGVTKEQDNGGPTYKLVPEVSINVNIQTLANAIQQSPNSFTKIARPVGMGVSINFGSIKGGRMKASDIDKAIKGSSVGIQVCRGVCSGAIKTSGGQTIFTYGVGTSQISITGGNMVQLSEKRKQDLFKILRFYK